jgi:hypothetical protein
MIAFLIAVVLVLQETIHYNAAAGIVDELNKWAHEKDTMSVEM